MKKRLLVLILPVLALVLELLPYGAVLRFGRPAEDGSIGYFRKRYSYFDLALFGYANFAPLLTGIITCILLVLLGIYCVTGKPGLAAATRGLTGICAIISLFPLLFGISCYSVIGALITIALFAEWIFLRVAGKLA